MGHSSLVGTDKAPLEAQGRDDKALGPSDSSDSASDRMGADAVPKADPNEPVDVTLSRDVAHESIEREDGSDEPEAGADISVDRVFDAEDVTAAGDDPADESAPEPRVRPRRK